MFAKATVAITCLAASWLHRPWQIRSKGEKLFKFYSTESSHMLVHSLGHRFPQMGDALYKEFAERMTSIVFGRRQPPVPKPPVLVE